MEARLKIRESSNYRGKFFSPISHQGTEKIQPHTLFGVVDMQPHNGKGNMYIHLSHVCGAEKRLDLTYTVAEVGDYQFQGSNCC